MTAMKILIALLLYALVALVHGDESCNRDDFQKYSLSSSLLFTCDNSEIKAEIASLRDEIQLIQQSCNDVRQGIEDFKVALLATGSSPNNPASNCNDILNRPKPTVTTGKYWLNSDSGAAVKVKCDFDVQLPLLTSVRGWQEIANINLSDPTDSCPSPLREVTSPSRRCERTTDNGGCESVFFPTNGVPFSRLCGRVVGYDSDTPDGFLRGTINDPYVDGLSITYKKDGTRQHIWTLVASHGRGPSTSSLCPCGASSATPPSFVGGNYYCERDNLNAAVSPLWDGVGCNHKNAALDGPCCENPNFPWFCREFNQPIVTDNIEVRVCTDERRGDEDIEFDLLKIYVQ